MSKRDFLANAALQAYPQCAELASHDFDTYLGASAGLRVVVRRVFFGCAGKLDAQAGEGFTQKLNQWLLVIALEDHLGVTQPEDINDCKANNEFVLINPFLGDHMCEDALGVVVSNQKTLANETLPSDFFESGSPGIGVLEA